MINSKSGQQNCDKTNEFCSILFLTIDYSHTYILKFKLLDVGFGSIPLGDEDQDYALANIVIFPGHTKYFLVAAQDMVQKLDREIPYSFVGDHLGPVPTILT